MNTAAVTTRRSIISISKLPDDLQTAVLKMFPGAISVSTDGRYVHCVELYRGDRFGGTASLRTSPSGIVLSDAISSCTPVYF